MDEVQQKLDVLIMLQQQVMLQLKHIHGRMEPPDEWLDSNDLCRLFKVTEKTIYRWRKNGLLKPFVKGRKCFYSKRAFSELIGKR